MKSILDLALDFRRRRAQDQDRALERVRESESWREEEAAAARDGAARRMHALRLSGQPTVCFGNAVSSRGESFPVFLSQEETWGGGHWTVTGATGAGKSFLAMALLLQRLRHQAGGLVVIDMKGELADLFRRIVLPSFIAQVGAQDPEFALELISKIAVLAPFDERAVPPFQVLRRDPSLTIPEQAHEVASSFGRTIGRDLGIIQETVLRYVLQLAIDTGHTLPEVARLLVDDDLRRNALERTRLEDVRHYFAVRFPRERIGSVGALLSRLDSLTMYPGLRRMLSTKGMVRFPALLESAITIIDLGGAPAGMREVPRFLGQLFFRKLVRAMFARRLREDGSTPPVNVVADEFQELLGNDIAGDFAQVLALTRSQRCYLWMLFQQAAQVAATSPTLLSVLQTNVPFQLMFRANIEDARHFSHVLPVTGQEVREATGFPDPRQPARLLTPEEERRALVDLVPRMPDRLYWFWHARAEYSTLLVRSPHLDLAGMQRQADALSPELRAAVARGVVALEPEIEPVLNAASRADEARAPARETPPPADGAEPVVAEGDARTQAASSEGDVTASRPKSAGTTCPSETRPTRRRRGPSLG